MDIIVEQPTHFVSIDQEDNELFQLGLLDATLYEGWEETSVDPTCIEDSTTGRIPIFPVLWKYILFLKNMICTFFKQH